MASFYPVGADAAPRLGNPGNLADRSKRDLASLSRINTSNGDVVLMECGTPYLGNPRFVRVCISPQSPPPLTEAAAQSSGRGFKYPRLRDTLLMQPGCSVM